jgi:transcriptional regulator with XRE-family HTH domain
MGSSSPGMPRARTVAAALLHARKAAGLSQREVAHRLGVAHTTIGRWEGGDTMPSPADMSALMTAFDIVGTERDQILALVLDSPETDWLASGPPGIAQQLAGVMECERTARHITEWSPMVVPGFLQTGNYARAVIGRGRESDPAIETLVMLRMGRRDVFMRPEPAELEALIAEPVIHGGIGGPKVMRDQLRHLHAMSKLDPVTVRLVNIGGEWHPGHSGPFIYYKFGIQSPVVYLEHHRSGAFLGDEADVAAYESAVDQIRQEAMSPEESADRIAQALTEMEKV